MSVVSLTRNDKVAPSRRWVVALVKCGGVAVVGLVFVSLVVFMLGFVVTMDWYLAGPPVCFAVGLVWCGWCVVSRIVAWD